LKFKCPRRFREFLRIFKNFFGILGNFRVFAVGKKYQPFGPFSLFGPPAWFLQLLRVEKIGTSIM
jgi:hypothetical protein